MAALETCQIHLLGFPHHPGNLRSSGRNFWEVKMKDHSWVKMTSSCKLVVGLEIRWIFSCSGEISPNIDGNVLT
jgi:hypothetical protein